MDITIPANLATGDVLPESWVDDVRQALTEVKAALENIVRDTDYTAAGVDPGTETWTTLATLSITLAVESDIHLWGMAEYDSNENSAKNFALRFSLDSTPADDLQDEATGLPRTRQIHWLYEAVAAGSHTLLLQGWTGITDSTGRQFAHRRLTVLALPNA